MSTQKDVVKRFNAKVSDYRKTFTSPQGKEVLDDMFRAHFMMSSSFQGDATQGAYNEGQRAVILRIMQILNTKPEKVRQIIEQMEKEV